MGLTQVPLWPLRIDPVSSGILSRPKMQTKSVINNAGRIVSAFEMLIVPMTLNIEVSTFEKMKIKAEAIT
jgi:hypothetical protein